MPRFSLDWVEIRFLYPDDNGSIELSWADAEEYRRCSGEMFEKTADQTDLLLRLVKDND